jgi:TonB family protein
MRHRVGFVFIACLIGLTSNLSAQDALARAKDLYLAAAYDEALVVLDRLRTEAPRETTTEIAQYRVFCLLALDRGDEARKAIEDIVNADPFYRPSETQTSPRIRNVFQDTRKALLPALVQRGYAEAKVSFENKDPKAVAQFDRVLALMDDPDLKGIAQLSDLRTVVSGFRDLSKAMASAPPPPPLTVRPSAAPVATVSSQAGAAETAVAAPDPLPAPPAGGKEVPSTFSLPIVISQRLPRWAPPKSVDARLGFKGSIEVMIDENGNVSSATLQESVHPLYDEELLAMARNWKYKPAMRNGVPTPYVKVVEIKLQPVR